MSVSRTMVINCVSQKERQFYQVTAFKFLHNINLIIYAISGKGLIVDQINQSNIPPLQSLPQQAFGVDQVIHDIEEIFNISEREHFIIAKSDTRLFIIFDQHQGDYSKLTIADQQSFKISQGKNVESSVCHKSKRYFFSDGPKVFSISPENKGNTLNFKEVYDLKSKHL